MTSPVLVAYFLYHFAIPAAQSPVNTQRVPIYRGGELSVKVTEIHGGSIAPGAQRVPMLDLELTATCGSDIPIYSIEVQRRGLGANMDIEGVYVMEGFKRLSRARQISSGNGFVQLRTNKVIVKACTTRKLSVYADFASDASPAGEHRISLVRSSDIDAGDATVILKNVRTQRKQTAVTDRESKETDVRQTVGTPLGTINVTYLTVHKTVSYGTRRTVGRIRLDADSVSNHLIHAITLTNEGTARDGDLQNLFLQVGLGSASKRALRLDGDRVRFVFDPPLSLQKNEQKIVVVRSDVRAGRSRTIQLLIEEPSDIEAVLDRRRD